MEMKLSSEKPPANFFRQRMPTQEVLFSPGNPAAISCNDLGFRPAVLRPSLSTGLPFSSSGHFRQGIEMS
jgi:hypothetical protein